MALNVNRSVIDPFYRYKMPMLQAKIQGSGKRTKTVIVNLKAIAKALGRPSSYLAEFFGCELGAQTNIDFKNKRYIFHGGHDAKKLQDSLDGFIKKFVLCPACDNPETVLTVKRQIINSKCKTCGHAFVIDPKHKLSTFILKNPPPEEDEDKRLMSAVKNLVIDKDLEKSPGERLDMLHRFFVKAKKENALNRRNQLLNEAERLELKNKAPSLLADVLFDEDVLTQIKTYKPLLYLFLKKDPKAQLNFLGGIEQLIEKHRDHLLPLAPHILKSVYDHDLVDEEVILSWGKKPSSKYVKKKFAQQVINECRQVLKWLEEAEEESSEEDDDDVEVVQ